MDFNQLRDHAHGTAIAKGWWESGARQADEIKMLMVSEVAEATEEARKNAPPIYQVGKDPTGYYGPGHDRWNPQIKPEGEAIELVDVIIRVADWFGWNKWDLQEAVSKWYPFGERATSINAMVEKLSGVFTGMLTLNPLEVHFKITRDLVNDSDTEQAALSSAIVRIMAYFQQKGWDLEAALEYKLAYNESRPHRHGGKRF